MYKILSQVLKDKKGKIILPFFIFGLCGLVIEVCFRASFGAMVGFDNLSYVSFMGFTSVWMILIYGFGGIILSIINEVPKYYNLKMKYQITLI